MAIAGSGANETVWDRHQRARRRTVAHARRLARTATPTTSIALDFELDLPARGDQEHGGERTHLAAHAALDAARLVHHERRVDFVQAEARGFLQVRRHDSE